MRSRKIQEEIGAVVRLREDFKDQFLKGKMQHSTKRDDRQESRGRLPSISSNWSVGKSFDFPGV